MRRGPRPDGMDLLRLFADHLLPVFLVAGVGYALAATLKSDPRPLAQVAFNVFAPCLVFQIIAESRVPSGDVLRMGSFAAVSLLLVGAAAFAVARLARWPRATSTAVVLCALLPNAGNFGMSANLLAFGEAGLTQASLYFLASSILTYTVGVLVASLGRAAPREALAGLARVPTIWAVAAAFALVRSGARLPGPAATALDLLADACIPAFLVILGMQLRGAGLRGPWGPLITAGGLRLAGGAAAGFLLAPLFGLQGPAYQAAVLQSAMPSAVINTILATEYDVEPRLVTSVVFATTLASPLLLTPVLALLR
uniref:AEC family transporter n=1 Tax=Eiseniibacteriota bacterium TaxID=2212470 RepID=A0A832I3K4_UNCEI